MELLYPKISGEYDKLQERDLSRLTEVDLALRKRYEAIKYYLDGDWAIHGTNTVRVRYEVPMQEFLVRLPQEALQVMIEETNFYFEDPSINAFAVNIQNARFREARNLNDASCFTIIIFKIAFHFSDEAIIGLLAHEFAHSFINVFDHSENERLTNAKLKEWGFESFYQVLHPEFEKLRR